MKSHESKREPGAAFGAAHGSAAATCKRCGKQFKPRRLKLLNKMADCCEACGIRNLCDGLGLPTPPELLDRHTKLPALTRRDFWAQLEADDDKTK